MNQRSTSAPLENGIAVIHSNQLEQLGAVVEYWLRQHPLSPLENEVFLVQSNGMGQWLKQNLAKNSSLGIAAALQTQLPSLFVWSVYRAVLGDRIPKAQALAKAPLTWRLYRLLPRLLECSGFEMLQHFLSDDARSSKRYQLAEQLADLFDQYQVYRSDWLNDWAEGRDLLRDAHGDEKPLPPAQIWQAALWRAVLDDLGAAPEPSYASRASVHAAFMARIDSLNERPAGLPRRVVLFGLSSLPQQALEVIAKLGKFCQIVLFVHNPCRYYWADIIEDKELLKAEHRRQVRKPGSESFESPDDLHLSASPLLAAWGKQGRDYIRLLDLFDEQSAYRDWPWPDNKIDLFEDFGDEGARSVLQHLQQSILDLEPVPGEPKHLPLHDDHSLIFHVAHSPQREVEILHDQLLARFEAAAQTGSPLHPRDVIVMVPDINRYAPHIRAVFGLHPPDDPRYIPYSLADQQQRGQHPLLLAVETLLNLPEMRFSVSELIGLLEVGALRARFNIDENAIGTLHRWIEQAGIRWGLDAEHRAKTVAMPAYLDANTWRFGLRRMLLGYAVGSAEAFNGIEPYEEIGGLEAQWLGGLALLIETLENAASGLQSERHCADWKHTLQKLLADFFDADNDSERKLLDTLHTALANWAEQCALAGLSEDDLLPIAVVRDAWLSAIDQPSLNQRFLTGRVNFCTLMPMRAIPFRQICLLGMNDGDYPRNQQPHGFDLMSQRGHYRPGDRSRRQDDQYLFLEALLSAREQLYISWVGRSIRDNSELPPSVLVSQLRGIVEQSLLSADGTALLPTITVLHPLQPFSADYVAKSRDPHLFTYAREWFATETKTLAEETESAKPEAKQIHLTLATLARFLRAPVKTFCLSTLKFAFETETAASDDHEPFQFGALQTHVHARHLLEGLQHTQADNIEIYLGEQQTAMTRKGALPLAAFAETAFANLAEPVEKAWQHYRQLDAVWPKKLPTEALALPEFTLVDHSTVQVNGELSALRSDAADQNKAMLHVLAETLQPKTGIKFHKLFDIWLQHLAACAEHPDVLESPASLQPIKDVTKPSPEGFLHGCKEVEQRRSSCREGWVRGDQNKPNNAPCKIESFIAAADGVLRIAPMTSESARAYLKTLSEAYLQGLQEPLPIACKTAFAWLAADPDKDPESLAQACYEGNGNAPGEVDYDPYLARFFPSFQHLRDADRQQGFDYWAERLYRPLLERITPYAHGRSALP